MNTPAYCSRKAGATINGKFYPVPTVTQILSSQYRRANDKARAKRRLLKSAFSKSLRGRGGIGRR